MKQKTFQDACERADTSFASFIEPEMDFLAAKLKDVPKEDIYPSLAVEMFSLSKKYTKILLQELLVNDDE